MKRLTSGLVWSLAIALAGCGTDPYVAPEEQQEQQQEEQQEQQEQQEEEQQEEQEASLWIYDPSTGQWQWDSLASGAEHFVAAAAVESTGEVLLFTASGQVGTLEISTELLTFTAMGSLTEITPGLAGANLLGAYGIPAGHAGSDPEGPTAITLMGLSGNQQDLLIWQFDFNSTARIFEPGELQGTVHEWDDADAPVPSTIRGSWLDVANAQGWAEADPSSYCEVSATEVGPYLAVITTSDLRKMDAGYCSVWNQVTPLGSFGAFAVSGAPPLDEVGATAWLGGKLWLFRGN